MTNTHSGTAPREARKACAKNGLVHGVGINDADYPIGMNEVIDGRKVSVWRCPFYTVWRSMLSRCHSSSYRRCEHTYAGCTLSPEWYTFSVFRLWMQEQHWRDKQIDKDLILKGNKVYSPDTCVFISGGLNKFLLESTASRGPHPLGVSWHKRTRKFTAVCCNPRAGKQEHLGYFSRAEDAHLAWATKKLEHALSLAEEQTDSRVSAALISRFTAKYDEAVAALTHTR